MPLTAFFAEAPWLLWLAVLMFGLVVGSFLNVVIYRLPLMLEADWRAQCRELLGQAEDQDQAAERVNLAWPGSFCPQCRHALQWFENLPLLSYLWQRGRCRHCGAAIPWRYPTVEGSAALLALLALALLGYGAQFAAALIFLWVLLALAVIDLRTFLLPDQLTLSLLWLGLLLNLNGLFVPLNDAVLGAVFGYVSLWSVYWLFRLVTGKEGMGFGDFKLLAAVGAWLGWQVLPGVILLSSLVGALVGIGLMLFKQHGREQPIPFGPYLAAGGALALLWREPILSAYGL